MVHQAALPEVQEEYQNVTKEIKTLQQQEHALQEESLNVRLAIEHIDALITKHNGKIKYWQDEVFPFILTFCLKPKSENLLVV